MTLRKASEREQWKINCRCKMTSKQECETIFDADMMCLALIFFWNLAHEGRCKQWTHTWVEMTEFSWSMKRHKNTIFLFSVTLAYQTTLVENNVSKNWIKPANVQHLQCWNWNWKGWRAVVHVFVSFICSVSFVCSSHFLSLTHFKKSNKCST